MNTGVGGVIGLVDETRLGAVDFAESLVDCTAVDSAASQT